MRAPPRRPGRRVALMVGRGAQALLIRTDSYFDAQRAQLVALAARYRLRMTRRAFLAAACSLACRPLGARAQRALPVVGVLGSASPEAAEHLLAAFRQALAEAGFVEGRTVAFAFRWAEGRYERLPMLAAELVRLPAAVIVATGGLVSVLAAKAATVTIPIVFTTAADPVDHGLVASLGRPGGNLTGIAPLIAELDAKRLEMLHELMPRAEPIGVLVNAERPQLVAQLQGVREAAERLGVRLFVHSLHTGDDLDAIVAALAAQQVGALLVTADPLFYDHREQLVALAAHHAIPTVYYSRDFVTAGGLASYGTSLLDVYRQAAAYVARILHGERPADLPVVQPTRVELVINTRAARLLGLAIAPSLLARADEVIE